MVNAEFKPTLLHRILILPLSLMARIFYFILHKLSRIECTNEHLSPNRRAFDDPAIYVSWNAKTFYLMPYLHRSPLKYLTFCDFKHWLLQGLFALPENNRLGFHSNGQAYLLLTRTLRRGSSVFIAGDGPYGPAGVLKEGASWLSAQNNIPIISMSVEVNPHLKLGWRWDNYEIGIPFSKIKIHFNQMDPKYFKDRESLHQKIEISLGSA